MKVILFVGSVVLLVTEVYGFLGRIGGVAYDGSGYYPFRVTQHPIYFPKCKEFVEALDRKMTEYESRPYNCMEAKDRDSQRNITRTIARALLDIATNDYSSIPPRVLDMRIIGAEKSFCDLVLQKEKSFHIFNDDWL
ncbi:hypothetical protein TNIN_362931 [Trichonephila inaurata madagascariensis]|uniref:Uncharacterized protein n=1 Tax=Trichonephila inaurata madagascariensis TaxID=2747483 RepID=A0A8X6MBD8_9ARAC|nr:hypothetical protein TNIN_362931 [Trichonephila inaurata madagascariensis]